MFDVSDNLKAAGRQETAFRYAVERINNRVMLNNSLLSAQIEKIPPRDSFFTNKKGKKRLKEYIKNLKPMLVCHLLKSGVAAIFGPESGTTSSTVQSICDNMEIPHVETRWDIVSKSDRSSVNLMPSPRMISQVVCQESTKYFTNCLFTGLPQFDRKLWMEIFYHPLPRQ